MKGRSPTLVFLAVTALVLFAPARAQAALITIDFSLPNGTVLTDQYLAQGVLFSADDTSSATVQAVVGVYGGADRAGTVTLQSYCNAPGYMQVDFINPTNYVSADFRNFEGDAPLLLEAYAANGTFLGSTGTIGANQSWYTLGFGMVSPEIAYVRLSGVNTYGVNAVQFDNLTFEATVPEPASLLLFGTGLVGLGALRKRRG